MSKVLVAEDEAALLEIYAELVAGLGHECVKAHDGNEALDLARQHRPDLVVTDYMMPGLTGVDVIRALRTDPTMAGVPAILLSAGRPPPAAQREASLFLKKPLTLESFERAVEETLKTVEGRTTEAGEAQGRSAATDVHLLREEMLSWVSHEIKSPLSSAMMAAQLAMRDLRAGPVDRASLEQRVAQIMRQLARMDELATSMLDAAQLQDGKLRLDVEDIQVSSWLREIVAFWQELHPGHEIALLEAPDVVLRGDRERLRQVIDNLTSNAIKYGKPSKRVEVTARATDDGLVIAVRDFGQGIPPSEVATIFDRFHRVAGQGGSGHGLGLYIAAALARLHGGSIGVASDVGAGSTFTLTLPRS